MKSLHAINDINMEQNSGISEAVSVSIIKYAIGLISIKCTKVNYSTPQPCTFHWNMKLPHEASVLGTHY
jgi:hypothetical protein